MTYMINARLDRGAPSLTLVDATTGKERLRWQGNSATDGGPDWQSLFKQLVLLSCADRLSLLQHSKSPTFSRECVDCIACVDQNAPLKPPTLPCSHVTKNDNDEKFRP